MTAKIIDGRKIASEIRKDISKQVNNIKSKYKMIPNITTIVVGDDPQSNLYLKLRDKACEEVGIKSSHIEFPKNIAEKEVLDLIYKLNKNDSIHGILVQIPLPNHISQNKLINAINPKKDVEGLNPYNIGRTLNNDEYIVPITPLSILTILNYEKTDFVGKNVVIINHSNHVGKPLAALLLNRNASVSVCHVYTKNLKFYTTNADILITAAGVANLINKEHVKKDSFVIDVAIVNTENGICGDVLFDSVKDVVRKITPVPGGVGPVTVACSLINMIKTFKNCIGDNE
ncbi:bifunctional 5,10-methylene-tetrahydrofolate dehydrogenase/5,10-methylene-tetrahydrofolate cyclohydrolase [Thermoplasmatales archaeon SG8-52-4]|nr:MAG: bifunctional 5,10-methylene-tetrahydrofolate dehydrogenase/5,10-methylene-tetrahydrofolate cyclohydrolase [Thermoplasmatales archaeon SG8-52-4]